jgi:predicted pyridoxine 5'-phosphate oxidase superfamily flavin-nucleotide-binding protein
MSWQDQFKAGKQLVLATSSKSGFPNANIVISLGWIDGKLLVADCQMKVTLRNLKENPKICVVAGYYRLKGKAKVFSSGKYFDLCVRKNKEYKVKNAILIEAKEVFDLNGGKSVKISQ